MGCSAALAEGMEMRAHFLTIVTAVALVLAVVADPGTDAIARPSAEPMATAKGEGAVRATRVAGTIYSQLDNDTGVSIVSQHFETRFLSFDSQGADDFEISRKAVVKQVMVDGVYFAGKGPANSIHVTFYENASGAPGAVVQDVPHAPFTDTTGRGSFLVSLPKLTLKPGTYWLSVFVNMPFTRGEWGWSTNKAVRRRGSLWRNPGDGFGTGCTSWKKTLQCFLAGEGGDFSFALLGKGH
jgi:hypothetical protein